MSTVLHPHGGRRARHRAWRAGIRAAALALIGVPGGAFAMPRLDVTASGPEMARTSDNDISALGKSRTASDTILLVWGGLDDDGAPYLRPSFFFDASPSLPRTGGPWSISGEDSDGSVLFSISFVMAEIADAGDAGAGFTFSVPVTWKEELAQITLRGPRGSAKLDRDSDTPMTILRDPETGRIRAILDGPPSEVDQEAVGPNLEVIFSRGIPR